MKTQTKVICIGAVLLIVLSGTIIMAAFDDREGPYIYEVDILPTEPSDGDTVSVVIYCIDSSGVASAELHSTLDGQEWDIHQMRFYTCLCIAGGRWVAQFGPVSYNDSPQFFVRAFDKSPARNYADTQVFTIQVSS